jgi:hypothetical protein
VDAALTNQVRLRANGNCEYCRMPQSAQRIRFAIDHIVARQHGGATDLGNLALSCLHCNSHKGPNLAGIDPSTRQLTPLFNPRREVWSEHFSWQGAELVGQTAVGRTTVDVLAINDPDYVALRASLIAEGIFPLSA